MKNIKLEKAKELSYPDGGGIWMIEGKQMRVHCNEYHMHSYNCLVEVIKLSSENKTKPD